MTNTFTPDNKSFNTNYNENLLNNKIHLSNEDEIIINFQPYKIKICEKIEISTKSQRIKWIKNANYNIFNLKSDQVMIDLLTDSGTGSLSTNQSAFLLKGDESYAGSSSYYNFYDTVKNLTNFKYIFPVHQGRGAERILFSVLKGDNLIVPNNTHFDTTRANLEYNNFTALDLFVDESIDPEINLPFKGNLDTKKLDKILTESSEKIPIVMMTLTNNAKGGQPASMENIKQVKKICEEYKKPLYLDGCRFAENCYFIKKREKGYENKSIEEIAKELFSYFDGMTMSAKKDGMSNIGGWLALNDDVLAEKIEVLVTITEGFKTYGGLAGRDLDIIAVGLKEVLDENYLKHRIDTIEKLNNKLIDIGVPVFQPSGGHAIFIDAKKFLPHIPASEFPGCALGIELYIEGGIRGCEIGSLMFGDEKESPMELLRLAIPRRTYSEDQLNHIVEVFKILIKKKLNIKGLEIVKQPKFLRHFIAELRIKEKKMVDKNSVIYINNFI